MVDSIRVLVASMTGTSELVADEVQEALEAKGATVELLTMDDLDPTVFTPGHAYVIVTSTYGQGDVPDNAQKLYTALVEEKPDLSHVSFGIFALGDMTYADTFCHGGKRFDEALAACGAKRVGEIHQHDASTGTLPEDEAEGWAGDWYDTASSLLAAA